MTAMRETYENGRLVEVVGVDERAVVSVHTVVDPLQDMRVECLDDPGLDRKGGSGDLLKKMSTREI
jgi:hypothetical protein